MNSGLDWMWVEMLSYGGLDWIGLDFEKWTHRHLWDRVGLG